MATVANFYDYVSPYVLNDYQLQGNGYPLWSPYFPGQLAKVDQNSHDVLKRPIVADGDPDRKCERCESAFVITQNNGSLCVHHPKRAWRAPGSNKRRHQCCYAPFRSAGCTSRPYHVTHQFTTAALTQFVHAPAGTYNDPRSKSVYALDTEMVYTTDGAGLARVTLVNANGAVVLDAKVRPSAAVIDCNTVHSGITDHDILHAPYTLETARQALCQFINADTILIGHSMENDLKALRMVHKKVVDTAVAFPHPKPNVKYSLKELALTYLNARIQQEASHCSAEDARSCMQLMRWRVGII